MREPTIAGIINNEEGRYEGDLGHYFRVLFTQARNLRHPYHNFRHSLHVMWLCYDAVIFYGGQVTKRDKRNLLIAAMFHDFDHSGQFGNDDLNIQRACRGLAKHIHPMDRDNREAIADLIKASETPLAKEREATLTASQQILRDADACQVLSVAWLQQVIFGLADEWGKPPLDVLRMQHKFLGNLRFLTGWARHRFPRAVIEEKIQEADALVAILEAPQL